MENRELYHYGVKGQKWGVRRYQNKDGTLTDAGKARYRDAVHGTGNKSSADSRRKVVNEMYQYIRGTDEYKKAVSDIKDTAYFKRSKYAEDMFRDDADSPEMKTATKRAIEQLKKQYPELKDHDDDYVLEEANHHAYDAIESALFDIYDSKYGASGKTRDAEYLEFKNVIDKAVSKIGEKTIGEEPGWSLSTNLRYDIYDTAAGYRELEHSEQDEAFISSLMSEDSDYLEHYGIKGMKWGIRRFQNKDGSLTKAGLKRYSDAVGKAVTEGGKKLGEAAGKAATAAKDKIAEKYAERKEEKRVEKLMSKPIRKLTEEERIERMDRKMKEKELLTLEKNVRDLDSGAMSRGRKFAEDMVTKVAIPSVLSAGEKQLTAFLNKKLGDALGLGEKKTTIIKDLLEGKKQITDLTDQDFNTVGKGAENWGNYLKNVLGKSADQNNDSGPSTTYLKDIISGKAKMSDFDDKTAKDVGKTAEAADNAIKVAEKIKNREKDKTDE